MRRRRKWRQFDGGGGLGLDKPPATCSVYPSSVSRSYHARVTSRYPEFANATIFHFSVFSLAGVAGPGSIDSAPADATAPEPAAAAAAEEGGCWGMVAVRCPPAVSIVVAAPAWPTGCVVVLAAWSERAPAVAIVGGAAGAPAGRRHQSPSFRASQSSPSVLALVAVLMVLVPSPRAAAAAPAATPRTSPDNP
jgi:hypothetical protein